MATTARVVVGKGEMRCMGLCELLKTGWKIKFTWAAGVFYGIVSTNVEITGN